MNIPVPSSSRCDARFVVTAVLLMLTPLSAPGAPVQISQSDAGGHLTSLTTSAAVSQPVISGHPQPALAALDGTATFSVSAGPAITGYQWRLDGNSINGATADTLTLAGLTAGQFGNYTVTVTNAAGSVTSNPAVLTRDDNGDGFADLANDTDGDRMDDAWEQTNFGNLTATGWQDSDNDGVTNGDEFTDGTNPRSGTSRYFRLALSPGVSAAPQQDRYAPASTVTLTARDESGLNFTEWSGAVTGFRNPVTLTMDADKSVTALRGTHVLDRNWLGSVTQNDGVIYRLVPLASGKIMVAGRFSTCQGVPAQNLARLNADLSVDDSFAMAPGVQDNAEIYELLEQPDGRLVIGGSFSTVNGITRRYLARLLPDGQLDNTFNAASGVNGQVFALARLSDGRLAISGNFSQIGATPRLRIALLHADGTLDPSFDPGIGLNDYANSIHVDTDDSLIVGGRFATYNGTPAGRLMKLSATGQLDAAFNAGSTGADNIIDTVRRLPGGRAVITGSFTRYNGTLVSRIAVLQPDGTLDTSFNPAGSLNNAVFDFIHQADGKFLISGLFNLYGSTSRSGIARLHADGTLDTSFNPGSGANNWVGIMQPLAGGRVLLSGLFSQFNAQPRERMAVIDQATGVLDSNTIPHAAFRGVVYGLAVQNDGGLLAGGEFTGAGGRAQNRIARFLPDGSLDTAFSAAGVNGTVYAVLPLRDGRIAAGGSFTSAGGIVHQRIARLLTDGTPDPAWPTALLDGDVYALTEDAQGRLLAGGAFNGVPGREQPGLMRFLPNGGVDTGFSAVLSRTSDFYGGFADGITEQPDGKILVCGSFDWASGTPAGNIARFHADGTPDAAFNANTQGGTNARARRTLLQPDGRIIVVGEFTIIGGLVRSYIARLQPDGTPDLTFGTTTSGANGAVYGLRAQPGGRLLLCGDFTTVSGIARRRIALLEADGTLVPDFNPGTGPDDNVYAIAADTAGNVYAGGWVREMADTPRAGLLRLTPAPGFDVQLTGLTTAGSPLVLSATAASNAGAVTGLRFESSSDGVNFSAIADGIFNGTAWTGTWTPSASGAGFIRAAATDLTARTGYSLARFADTGATDGWNDWLALHFTPAELANPALSGASADPDHDNQPNLAEFASGTDPRSSTSALPPLPSLAAGNFPAITFQVTDAASDVTWSVETSTDLAAWNSGPAFTTLVSNSPNGDGTRTLTVRTNQAIAAGTQQMLRVRYHL